MSKSSKGEGIKIAQAAKDLGVTSVTIRRYISEFDIETTSDENGIKVLPERAMEEMYEIRRLKEEGLTNPKVMEHLEEMRAKREKSGKSEAKKTSRRAAAEPAKKEAKKPERRSRKVVEEEEEAPAAAEEAEEEEAEEAAPKLKMKVEPAAEAGESPEGEAADGRSKHTLTCQTCSKTFEHMNPRLRDCLECYRAKRKERRRDKHKNVIQHPLAAQVTSKQQQRQRGERGEESFAADTAIDVTPTPVRERGERFDRADRADRTDRADRVDRADRADRTDRTDRADRADRESSPLPMSAKRVNPLAGTHKIAVRNYRKAIEETRQITANLKRRLERPDLPENERRWLEQIYAYQLILHQGWRHLAEYKAGTQGGGGGGERGERGDRAPRQEV